MVVEAKYVKADNDNAIKFSVCSLVRDMKRYELLLDSFSKFGFTEENAEFLAGDNRDGNQFDGYSWVTGLYPHCRGEYLIFCHEDIVLIEHGFDDLVAQLKMLDDLDPSWLLAGVAGGQYRPQNHSRRQVLLRMTDKFGSNRVSGSIPGRVETLDECFIIMKRKKPVFNSYDLSGFHFYGPDICLMADLMGGSCYALDFHLQHNGNAEGGRPFRACKRGFINKYRNLFPGRTIHCTTGAFHLNGGWSDRT